MAGYSYSTSHGLGLRQNGKSFGRNPKYHWIGGDILPVPYVYLYNGNENWRDDLEEEDMTEKSPDPCPCLTCALWTAAKAWFAKEGAPEDAIDEEALLSTIGDMAGEIMANACCEEEGSNRFEILLAAIQERCQEEGHKFEVEKQELPSSGLMN